MTNSGNFVKFSFRDHLLRESLTNSSYEIELPHC